MTTTISEDTKTTASIPAPSSNRTTPEDRPFLDLTELRLSQDFAASIAVKKALLTHQRVLGRTVVDVREVDALLMPPTSGRWRDLNSDGKGGHA